MSSSDLSRTVPAKPRELQAGNTKDNSAESGSQIGVIVKRCAVRRVKRIAQAVRDTYSCSCILQNDACRMTCGILK
jgi:hypothetical protein